jgi:Fe2+ transport system protein B
MKFAGQVFDLIDLPGTYSLAPRSPDEMVAVELLLGQKAGEPSPSAVVIIVDASNLERNLYLMTQVRELGVPVIVALNMMDVARNQGLEMCAPLTAEGKCVTQQASAADVSRRSRTLGGSVCSELHRPICWCP